MFLTLNHICPNIDEFPRFLHWMPKNRLSTLLKRTLLAWQMVSDGLGAEDVSFIFLIHLWKFDLIFLWVCLLFFYFGLFCDF